MADEDPYQIWIYRCPPEEQPAAAEILSSFMHGFDREPPDDGTVTTGEPYIEDESGLSDRDSVADRLIASAPGASFYSWQGPMPGFRSVGTVTAYTPWLGRYDGYCDGDGHPVLRPDQVRRILRDHPGGGFEKALARESGEEWEADWLACTSPSRPAPLVDGAGQGGNGGRAVNEWTVTAAQTRGPGNASVFTLDAGGLVEALAGALFQASGSWQAGWHVAQHIGLAAGDPGADVYGDVADLGDLVASVMADGQARHLYRDNDVTCALVIPVPEEPR